MNKKIKHCLIFFLCFFITIFYISHLAYASTCDFWENPNRVKTLACTHFECRASKISVCTLCFSFPQKQQLFLGCPNEQLRFLISYRYEVGIEMTIKSRWDFSWAGSKEHNLKWLFAFNRLGYFVCWVM